MSDVLREAIEASGLSLLKLQQETGVNRSSLSRFLRGDRSLRLDVADKLAEFLGLQLTPADDRPQTKKK
jgi:transcriptional regulator with XRE-family HTH domain